MAELIREKVFSVLDKEVPYSISVETEHIEEKADMTVITAHVMTDEERYKRIIIGEHARRIKEIGQLARRELEQALNKKIYLELDVVVDKHWVERLA
jgi:GTP-binding protein Era